MVLNSVMVGFFTAVTGLLEKDAVLEATAGSVPSSFRELNTKAFEKGFQYATWKGAPETAEPEHVLYSQE